jgi:serine/threonine protein kinase/tetratricopeptide (TPR) repeat protein
MSSTRERLGPYEILRPLGAGGMGEVYVARDPVLARKVAIKVLPVRLSDDRDTLTRFTHEARSASSLNHPNIVTIHDIDTESGRPYIVMEYIDGRDLRSYIREGPLTTRKMLDVAAQIAEGLAAAHEVGIVHRDLKPENIMVTKDGFVKILDFGLAKMTRPAEDDDVTARLSLPGTTPGTILGTVGYMSPEQATGKPLDSRSDQFALGAILYELATGKPAFDAPNAIDTLSAILHDEPPSIRKINPKVPEQFCWIVERLLAKSPADRYETTRDAARELRAMSTAAALDDSADSIWSIRIPPAKARAMRARKRMTMAVASAIALVVLGTLGYTLWRFARPSAEKRYVALMRFRDLSGDPNGQFVVDGLAETLASRLAHFSTVQVMRPSATDSQAATDVKKAARDLGANLALIGSMQRAGNQVRIAYRVLDVARGVETGDVVDGPAEDLFAIEDRLAISVATTLHLGPATFHVAPGDATVSRARFLEALGRLRRYDSEPSVDSGIQNLEELGAKSNSASVQAALGRAYLYKFQLTHDPKWAVPASQACQRAVDADPQNTDVHVTLGDLSRQTGKLDAAAAAYKAALAQEPNNAEAILGLAETYKAAGKVKEAEAAYQKAIALQPNYWGGYSKLGVFYFTHGRPQDAANMFETVIRLVPDNLRGLNNLGAAYEQMGRFDDAVRIFQRSIAVHPTDQAYSNLGTCQYFLGHYSDAAAAFEKATALTPKQYFYWANLGDAYRWVAGNDQRAAGAYDEAIRLARDELHLNPTDAGVRARLAECLAKRGQVPEAREQIAKALTADRANVGIMYRAAVVENACGDTPKAVEWLKKAISAGYDRTEMQRDPEFALLRESDAYKRAFARVQ